MVVAQSCRGHIVTPPHPRERIALVCPGHGHDDERSTGERRERERQSRMRVLGVASGDHEARDLVEGGRAREERCRVAVGAEPEMHEPDRWCAANEVVVPGRRGLGFEVGVVHGVDGAGFDLVEEGDPGHPLVGVGIVHRDPAFVPEEHVDRCPIDVHGREQLVAAARGIAARQRDRTELGRRDQCGEGLRNVGDRSHLADHETMIRPMDRATVAAYETGATRWRDARPARFIERAQRLGLEVPEGVPRLDAGCGAGLHVPALGRPVVALDAAFSMTALVRDVAADAWPVQADLEQLPFRRGALGGSWARASYLHVARDRLPWALMELHAALQVGAPAEFTYRHGDQEGAIDDDEFPGRFFAEWSPERLAEVHTGAGFDVEECTHDGGEWIILRAHRARTLPDFVGPDMRLLVCGLNPSLYAADAGVGFARPGNRFWPAAIAAGLVTRDRDPRHALGEHGVGMTDLVKRATRKAAELTTEEYSAGISRVGHLVRWLRPRAVCFVGLTGYRAAVDRRAKAGALAGGFAGVPAYLMPNPSGANAHVSLDDVAAQLRAALALTTGVR